VSVVFQKYRDCVNAKLNLFCFPYAGGCASVYRDLANSLPESVQLWSFQLPGREERFGEPFVHELHEVKSIIMGELSKFNDKPYIILGYSMGGRLAYEAAILARKFHMRSPEAMIVCAAKPPHKLRDKIIYNLPDDEFVAEIRDNSGTSQAVLDEPSLMEILLPRLRADYQICETAPKAVMSKLLSCDINICSGKTDDGATPEDMNYWANFSSGNAAYYEFDAGHFFINDKRDEFNTLIAKILDECCASSASINVQKIAYI